MRLPIFSQLDNSRPLIIFLYLYLLTLLLTYSLRAIGFANEWHGWNIAEWLINYDYGFVRRGLSGEFIGALSSVTGFGLNFIVAFLAILAMAAFIFLLSRAPIYSPMMGLAMIWPTNLSFYFTDHSSILRKDILIILFSLIYVFALPSGRLNSNKFLIIFSIASIFLTLTHELFLFYTPFFICASFLLGRGLVRVGFAVALSSFATAAALLLFAKPILGSKTCLDLLSLGATESVCHGILEWPFHSLLDSFNDVLEKVGPWHFLPVIAVLFVSTLPNYLYLRGNFPISAGQSFIVCVTAMLACLAPLFFIAHDYGRWIHLFSMQSMFLCFVLVCGKALDPRRCSERLQRPPRTKPTILCLVLATGLLFELRHCCAHEVSWLRLGPLARILAG